MERHGIPIAKYGLSGASKLNVGITYSTAYREAAACVAMGLDYEKWRYGGYTREFMDEVLAFHDMSKLIETNIKDAEAAESKKNSRKGRKGKKG